MSSGRLNLILLAALAVCLLLIFTTGRDYSRPNIEFMPDMAHAIPYETFAANPVFSDGKTLQTPPDGTIPRGHRPIQFEGTEEDALRAGLELVSPVAADDQEARQRGAFVFSAFCQQCHGPTGLGDGPVARAGFPPPPSLMLDKTRQMPDGQIFHVLTFGQGNMPGHAPQISEEDRWKAVGHIRVLQQKATAAEAAAAAEALAKEALEPSAAATETGNETENPEPVDEKETAS